MENEITTIHSHIFSLTSNFTGLEIPEDLNVCYNFCQYIDSNYCAVDFFRHFRQMSRKKKIDIIDKWQALYELRNLPYNVCSFIIHSECEKPYRTRMAENITFMEFMFKLKLGIIFAINSFVTRRFGFALRIFDFAIEKKIIFQDEIGTLQMCKEVELNEITIRLFCLYGCAERLFILYTIIKCPEKLSIVSEYLSPKKREKILREIEIARSET